MRSIRTRILAFTVLLALAGCKVDLNTNLSEADANEIIATLIDNGISASKEMRKEGVSVIISSDSFSDAVAVLRTNGLPRRNFDTVSDVFKSEGIVASPLQEWAKLNYAKEQELSRSISGIPGVIRADVHLGEIRQESPFEDVGPASASVLIQIDESMIPSDLVPEIKQLVSLAHPKIEYDRVGVIVTPVNTSRHEAEITTVAGIRVHSSDVPMIYGIIGYAGAVTVGLLGACAFMAFLKFRPKLVETAK